MVKAVIPTVSVKSELGSGPITAPSVQQPPHPQLAVAVPSSAFQSLTSEPSSLTSTAGGVASPVSPVEVIFAESLSPHESVESGASREMTR